MAEQHSTRAPSRTVRAVDSDPDMNEALRRVRATAAVTLPPLPAQPAARRRALAVRGW